VRGLLTLTDVGKRYRRGERSKWLLRNVTLSLQPGELVSVVGMRGQGKTTLLGLAAGMFVADEGRVQVCGTDLKELSDQVRSRLLREQIGWASRGGPGIRVRMLDYVALRLAVGGRHHRREAQSLALAALERVDMEHCAERYWDELSDWDRTLIELAQAVAGHPRLLLVDDLLDGLGLRETEVAAQLLRELAEERRMGVLMSASDVEAALSSQRVLSLADCRLAPMSRPAPQPRAGNVVDFPRGRRLDLHGAHS
jgi:ABC-type lipoprotein export system ATPase subunit